MKKRIWIAAAMLLMLLAAPAFAQDLPLVVDDAGLLTIQAAQSLTTEAQRLSQAYGMDVVILTVQNLNGKTARDFAADYYDEKGYGQGERYNGVMLMLAMADRDWYILTTGSGISAFTDYGLKAIEGDVLHYFSAGDYEGGFRRFLRDAEITMQAAKEGKPYDVNHRVQFESPMERVGGIVWYLLAASLLIAGAIIAIMVSGMNTARPQWGAGHYVRDGSMAITRMADIFLYHTQTRVRIEKQQSSGGGGGSSTFQSSSGGTHGGSGGKF